MPDPAKMIAAALRAAAAPESGYASQQAAHAVIVTELRRLGLDSGTARVLADRSAAIGVHTSTPLSPAMAAAHDQAAATRAAYLTGAAGRLAGKTGLARLDQQTAERRHLNAHVAAQTAREQAALRLDAATAAYGPLVGWHAVLDERTTPTCKAMHGHNFDPAQPPAAGLPGISHVGCRCKAGLPHPAEGTENDEIAAAREVPVTFDLATSSASLDRSPRKNWVEKSGGLPPRVRKIARALKRKHPSWSLSRCIATAINVVKKTAATGDLNFPGRQNVTPKTRAAHTKAAASWTALKARNAARDLSRDDQTVIELGCGCKVTRADSGPTKRKLDAESRRGYAEQGAALPDGSFPIKTRRDLANAIRALGRTTPGKRAEAAAHIRKRAKVLGVQVSLSVETEAIELASYPCGTSRCHLPGTKYNWRHGWRPLNVQTALTWKKQDAAKKLHAKGAAHANPESKSYYRKNPGKAKTLWAPMKLEAVKAKTRGAAPVKPAKGLEKVHADLAAAPDLRPNGSAGQDQVIALQKAIKTGKTQYWVDGRATGTQPKTGTTYGVMNPDGSVAKVSSTGTASAHNPDKLKAVVADAFAKSEKKTAPGDAPAPAKAAKPLGPKAPKLAPGQQKKSSTLGSTQGPAPAPKPAEPAGKPIPGRFTPVDTSTWVKKGGQKGSNPGGTYVDGQGVSHYVKTSKTDSHARNEALAAGLYHLAGVKAADVRLVAHHDKIGTASPLIPGAKSDFAGKLADPDYKRKAQSGFAVDAWLGNWDVAGLNKDNIVTDANGDPVRVDPGGALLYRAQGTAKGTAFGNTVGEWDTLRDTSKNPQAASVFSSMSDAELKASARKVVDISPAQIEEMVDKAGFDQATALKLKGTLKARRVDLAKRAGLDLPEQKKTGATWDDVWTKKPAAAKVSRKDVEDVDLDTPDTGKKPAGPGATKPKADLPTAVPAPAVIEGKRSKKGALVVQAPAGNYKAGDTIQVKSPKGNVHSVEVTGVGKEFTKGGVPHQYAYVKKVQGAPANAPASAPKTVTPAAGMETKFANAKAAPDLVSTGSNFPVIGFQKAVKTGKPHYQVGSEISAIKPTGSAVGIEFGPDGSLTWVGGGMDGKPVEPSVVKSLLGSNFDQAPDTSGGTVNTPSVPSAPSSTPAAPKAKLKNPPTKAAKGLGPTNKALYNAEDIPVTDGSTPVVSHAAAMQKAIKTGKTQYLADAGYAAAGPSVETQPEGKHTRFDPDGSITTTYNGTNYYATKPTTAKKYAQVGLSKIGTTIPKTTPSGTAKGASLPNTSPRTPQVAGTAPDSLPEFAHGTGKGLDSLHPNVKPWIEGTPEGAYIERHAPGLPGESKIAAHAKAHTSWSATEQAAVKKYQGSYAWTLNGKLRTGGTLSPTDKAEVAKLDAAIAKYAVPETVVVNRGLGAAHFPTGNLVGQVLQDSGYMSTSFQSGFGGQVKMHLVVPKGTHGAPVKAAGSDIGEGELILPRGTQILVSKDETDASGTRHVTATVVPTPQGSKATTGVVDSQKITAAGGAYSAAGLKFLQAQGRAAWLRKYGLGDDGKKTGLPARTPALAGVGG